MNCLLTLVLIVVCLATVAKASEENDDACLYCHIMMFDGRSADASTQHRSYQCRTEPDQDEGHGEFMYNLNNNNLLSSNSDFMKANGEIINSGRAFACIPGGEINRQTNQIDIPDATKIYFLETNNNNNTSRRLSSGSISGSRSILAVHLTINDQAPVVTASKFQGVLHGIGPDAGVNSVVGRYADCSFSKLTFYPAPTTGITITDGLAELSITLDDWAGTNITDHLNPVVTAIEAQLGGTLDRYDHVMICVPFGTEIDGDRTWNGYGSFNYFLSFINSNGCEHLTLMMHEIGHNLGLHHAGQALDSSGCDEYGDWTDVMGEYYYNSEGPKYCFNGWNNAIFGWYQDKMKVVDDEFIGRLVSFTDYPLANTANNEYVLLEVTGVSVTVKGDLLETLYVQWNLAKGINEGVFEAKNKITISGGRDDNVSYRLGDLDQGQSMEFSGGVTIEVCGFSYGSPGEGYAVVSVHRTEGGVVLCDQGDRTTSTTSLPTFPNAAPIFYSSPQIPVEYWTAKPQVATTSPPLPPTFVPPTFVVAPTFVVPPTFVVAPTFIPPTLQIPEDSTAQPQLPTSPPTTPTFVFPSLQIPEDWTAPPRLPTSPSTSPSTSPLTSPPTSPPTNPPTSPIFVAPTLQIPEDWTAPPQLPTRPPTTSTFVACFPGNSMVFVENVGAVQLRNVQLGDSIKVGKGRYEPIYSFGHFQTNSRQDYLQLETRKSTLELSSDHLVFVKRNDVTRTIPASLVKVGDELVDEAGASLKVQSVNTVSRSGTFAPFTPSGKLVVNGIMASSYVAFQNSENLMIDEYQSPFSYQWLAHTFQFPHRVVCVYFGKCLSETYTEDGISTWVAAPLRIAKWLLAQGRPSTLLLLVTIPFASLLAVFSAVECVLMYPLTVAVMGLSVLFIFLPQRKLKTA